MSVFWMLSFSVRNLLRGRKEVEIPEALLITALVPTLSRTIIKNDGGQLALPAFLLSFDVEINR